MVRALVWPAIAVAAAVAMTVFNPGSAERPRAHRGTGPAGGQDAASKDAQVPDPEYAEAEPRPAWHAPAEQ